MSDDQMTVAGPDEDITAAKQFVIGEDFLKRIVEFSHLLRQSGLVVTISETVDAVRAITLVELFNEGSLYNCLRTTLVKRQDDLANFDIVFRKFWLGEKALPSYHFFYPDESKKQAGTGKQEEQVPFSNAKVSAQSVSYKSTTSLDFNDDVTSSTKPKEQIGLYSPHESPIEKNFQKLDTRDPLLKRNLRAFVRKMTSIPGRRYSAFGIEKMDFRRTLRSSLKSGGQIIDAKFGDPSLSKSHLVLLCDVSGSMDRFSNRILELLYYACNHVQQTKVFVFSTRLVSFNKYIQGKSFPEAAYLVSKKVNIWSSGTRIGSALGLLLSNYPSVLRRSTVLVIISDGWELSDLEQFKMNLSEVRRRIASLAWLNPQADSPDFRPISAGMKTAMPFLDFFSGLDIFTDRIKFERAFSLRNPKRDRNLMGTSF